MKPVIFLPLMVAAGAGTGGGAAALVRLMLDAPAAAASPEVEGDLVFVPTGPILTPIVRADGRLSGYAEIQVELQVSAGAQEMVQQRLPVLLHAVNLRSFRTPLTSAPDGEIPNLTAFRKLVDGALSEAFGPGVVRRVAITQARPA